MPEKTGPKPIRDYETLVSVLVERRDTLSRRHSQLAKFCLNHPEDMAINTIVRLAEQALVPPATITRFAKELGFSGFPDLQAVFRERVLGPGPSFAERLADVSNRPGPDAIDATDLEKPGRVFELFVQSAISSLVRIDQTLDHKVLENVVEKIAKADAVHIMAARGAFGIGGYMFYGLANIGKRAHLIDNLGAMRAEQLAAVGPNDVLLVITFDDYTAETIEIAKLAAGRGQQLLAITDNELSPVAEIAEHVLFVKEAQLGHFRSQVPAMVVCQSVIVGVGRSLSRAS
ncbi:MAG: MurR/RpiR family transcriptional regulator [Paracoccaceae bacterium]